LLGKRQLNRFFSPVAVRGMMGIINFTTEESTSMRHDDVSHATHSREARGKYWRTHLAAQERSGLTLAEYCRRNRLSKSTFGWWKRELRDNRATPVTLVPVSIIPQQTTAPVKSQDPSSGVALITRNGCRIEIGVGFHPPTLERVLQTLGMSASNSQAGRL
jgi:hypothetical protein